MLECAEACARTMPLGGPNACAMEDYVKMLNSVAAKTRNLAILSLLGLCDSYGLILNSRPDKAEVDDSQPGLPHVEAVHPYAAKPQGEDDACTPLLGFAFELLLELKPLGIVQPLGVDGSFHVFPCVFSSKFPHSPKASGHCLNRTAISTLNGLLHKNCQGLEQNVVVSGVSNVVILQ